MSGFIGVFRRDGSPIPPSYISGMRGKISHRGPDASGVWSERPVALGHAMLWTTPESLIETLPFSDPVSGLAITCDARIDNRRDLIESLGLRISPREITDSCLILTAYQKWGEECPARLVGDFAFVIWDKYNGKLFCARDAMGVKSFYYYLSDSLFSFGSEIKAVLHAEEVPRKLNETRILDYFVNLFDDRRITFYKDVFRLPAATTLTITQSGVRSSNYWSLDAGRELKLSSDEEYNEAFRSCFSEATRCRLRSAFPVVSTLSGGLDSSSIACVARRIYLDEKDGRPLDTISLVFPGLPDATRHYTDERRYIDCVLGLGGFRPHFVRADELSPMSNIEQIHFHLDEAFFAGNLYLHWAMYQTAHANGHRVFLDGLDGDTTVSHGFEYLGDLVMGLKWKTLYKEMGLLGQNLGLGRKHILREYCIKPFCPTWVFNLWRRLHGHYDDTRINDRLLSAEFRERLRLNDRVNSLLVRSRSCLSSARQKHKEMLSFPLFAHALELADKCSAAFHLESRYPFFDRRLIELCLSLPGNQKLGNGWSRVVLRRAMEGILPKAIQWRPEKGDLSPNFYRRLLEGDRAVLENILLRRSSLLSPYVDLQALQDTYRRFESNPLRSHDDSLQIFAAVNLAVWLDSAQLAP